MVISSAKIYVYNHLCKRNVSLLPPPLDLKQQTEVKQETNIVKKYNSRHHTNT